MSPASSSADQMTTGPAAAAVLGAGLGLVTLAIAHVFAEASEPVKHAMQSLGNLWMPGAQGIGPYSGKETVALVVWLLSWTLLHAAWRKRDVNLTLAGVIALLLVGIATTLLWPPVTHLLVS